MPRDAARSNRQATRQSYWWNLAHYLYVAIAMFVLTGVNFGSNDALDAGLFETGGVPMIEQIIMLAGGIVFAARFPEAYKLGLRRLAPFLGLLAFALLSAVWSPLPMVTLRRSVSLANVMLFALYATIVLGVIRTCRIQVAAMAVAGLAGLVVAVLVPDSGFDVGDNAGALRGVFTQKNALGDAMVVGMLAQSCLILHRPRIRWQDLAYPVLAFAIIVLSRSLTSLVLASLIVALTLLARLWVLRSRYLAVAVTAAIGAAIMLAFAGFALRDTLFALVGKSSDLTGRVAIWEIIRAQADGITMLGSGYSAFWRPESSVAQTIWREIGFVTSNGHNGYLQTLLELGIVGLALMFALYCLTLGVAARAALAGRRAAAAWIAILVLVALIFNYDEASWPNPDAHLLQWMIGYLLCCSAIAAALRAPGAERAAGAAPD